MCHRFFILMGAGASVICSSLFYSYYQKKMLEVQKLKADQHLKNDLNATLEKSLHYVAVEGVVQPVGESLASHYMPQCFGVVQHVTTLEHWKVQGCSGSWVPKTKTVKVKEMSSSVLFQLVHPDTDHSNVCVRVESPFEATGDYLEEVHWSFRPAEDGLLDILRQALSGEKLMVREEREELLRVGTVLTGFGEVVLEHGGVMRLQPPRDGRSFVLLPGDHRSFIQRHENTAGMLKRLTVLFGITATVLLGTFVYSALF